MDKKENTMLFFVQSGERRTEKYKAPAPRVPRSYILYCCMTLSVMLLTIAFAATELFSVFFSDMYPDKFILSKFFGADADSGLSFEELMLYQSFGSLSFGKKDDTADPPVTTVPSDTPESPTTTEKPNITEPQDTSAPPETDPPSETSAPADIYAPDERPIPSGMGAILPMDLSSLSFGMNYIHNTSEKAPNMQALAAYKISTDISGVYPADAPLVLIVHTHGTEGYSESYYYDPNAEIARTTDKNKNVVHIGKIIADSLNNAGISTIHCDIMHDEKSYSGSYDRSAATIKEYLAKYPSIRYVIDVHRDAIVRSGGELVRPVALTDRGATAQVMAVVGTGESTVGCPNYMANLALAQRLRSELSAVAENLTRPTCLRPSAYNQQYSVYSMLLEIGAAGNTQAEAERAAELVGAALSRIIKE